MSDSIVSSSSSEIGQNQQEYQEENEVVDDGLDEYDEDIEEEDDLEEEEEEEAQLKDVLTDYTYSVTIVKAMNLPKMTRFKSTNGFCILAYKTGKDEEKIVQTQPVVKTRYPKWKMTFLISNLTDSNIIFDLYHYNKKHNKAFGRVVIDLKLINRNCRLIEPIVVSDKYRKKMREDLELLKISVGDQQLDPKNSYLFLEIGRIRSYDYLCKNLQPGVEKEDGMLFKPLLQVKRADCFLILRYDKKGYSYGLISIAKNDKYPYLYFMDQANAPSYRTTIEKFEEGVEKYNRTVYYEQWVVGLLGSSQIEDLCVGFITKPTVVTLEDIAKPHNWNQRTNMLNSVRMGVKDYCIDKKGETVYLFEENYYVSIKENQVRSEVKIMRNNEDLMTKEIKLITSKDKTRCVLEHYENERMLKYEEKGKKIDIGNIQQVIGAESTKFPINNKEIEIKTYKIDNPSEITYVKDLINVID